MNCKVVNNLTSIFLVVLFLVNASCSPKASGYSADENTSVNPLKELKAYKRKQGDMDGVKIRKGKEEEALVHRVIIDKFKNEEKKKILEYLRSLQPNFINNSDYIFIHFYPGKDDCNSTGLATRKGIGTENQFFNEEIEDLEKVDQLNFYSDNNGIERWNKNREWMSDSLNLIKNYFFPVRTSCSNHVIIHKSGKHFIYNGPSSLRYELEDLDLFMRIIEGGYF